MTTHLHTRHRGQVPDTQLATGSPSSGDVPTSDGAGGVAWTPSGGGGGSDFDIAGISYRFPAGGGYKILEQEDLSDGTDATLFLSAGTADIYTQDASSHYAEITAQGTGNIFLAASAASSATGGLSLGDDGGGNGQARLDASDLVILAVGVATGYVWAVGGMGVKFPELSADPGSPPSNLIYFNTSTNKHRAWDGSAWHNLY